MNFYLTRKVPYSYVNRTPGSYGCTSGDMNAVKELKNGLVWNDTYYSTIKALNKDFYQIIHIGKSSLGWYFGLAIYPELNINTLKDWKELFYDPKSIIYDEEDRIVDPDEMMRIITERKAIDWDPAIPQKDYEDSVINNLNDVWQKHEYDSYEDILKANSATRGNFGLWKRDHEYVIYPQKEEGLVTYDYIISGNDPETSMIFS